MLHLFVKQNKLINSLQSPYLICACRYFKINLKMSSISILQELCDRNRTPHPIYELLADGTTSRDKVFIYQCTAQFETAQGIGKSKKEAKYDSATNILKLISYQVDKKSEVIPEDVAVGDLIKLCAKMKIGDPKFNVLNESGLPHNVEFTYECCVGIHRVVAQHSTKKGAKKLAAHKMFQLIN